MRATRVFLAVITVLAISISLMKPASATLTLNATWMVTYYLDPTGAQGSSECVNFTGGKHTNGIVTGQWNSPTLPGWTGQWVERGQHYAWHGFYTKNGVKIATYDVGDFVNANITAESSIGQLMSSKSGPSTIETGTATMVQVPSCAGLPIHRGNTPLR